MTLTSGVKKCLFKRLWDKGGCYFTILDNKTEKSYFLIDCHVASLLAMTWGVFFKEKKNLIGNFKGENLDFPCVRC